jgi:ADP-dependent phosphofructokinase/glucokinase
VNGFIAAFNVNIDAIIPIKTVEISRLIDTLSPDERSKILSYLDNPPLEVYSPLELLGGILYSLCNGKTIELTISNIETHNWIKNKFQPSLMRIGGQAGNMAYQLSRLGVKKIYVSIPRLTLLQAKTFLNIPNILTPIRYNDGKIEFRHPLDIAHYDQEDLIHWVFEIRPQKNLILNTKRCESTSEVRFIGTYDECNSKLEFKEEFRIGSLKIAGQVDYAIASGYHLLKRNYSDGSCPEDHIRNTIYLIKSWKNVNPDLKIHYEHGFNRDLDILRLIFDNVRKVIDSVGLNEVELPFILQAYGFEKQSRDIWNKADVINLFEGIRKLHELLDISHLVLHTREFSMSLMSSRFGLDPKYEVESLLFGNLLAATAAVKGDFPTLDEVKSVTQDLDINMKGVEYMRKLIGYLKMNYPGRTTIFENSMMLDSYDFMLSFAVAKNVVSPKITVGLGDSFTAGMLAAQSSSKRDNH